jgi:hypothetical protein
MRDIVNKIASQWVLNLWMKAFLVSLTLSLLIYWVFNINWAAGISFPLALWLFKATRPRKMDALAFLHAQIPSSEYSLDLLEKDDLNIAEQLQLQRLEEQVAGIKWPSITFRGLWPYLAGLVVAVGISRIEWPKSELALEKVLMGEKPRTSENVPELRQFSLKVTPPSYSKLGTKTSSDGNVSALVGSTLDWELTMSASEEVKVVLQNSRGEELSFSKGRDSYTYRDRLINSGIYSVKAVWKDSIVWQSDYFKLEAIEDQAPKIDPDLKELYSFHSLGDPHEVKLSALVSDDFLVTQVYLVATLARGSGENVKFREVRFPVSNSAFRSSKLQKSIDLKSLNFAPGDELYYYWAALDNRQPQPNFTKSDTYFLVYKDTSARNEANLATMAVNILPEYFRSQRQIIIDTEKLIKKRNKIPKQQFNEQSNEIGFDQKALRIRYGQYLGEEYETSIGGHQAESDDPLEGFMHKHDSEEEGHHDHHHEETKSSGGSEEGKDPLGELLEAYMHSHDDGEINTFYEESTRSLLKTALENMWQSELHLRLYEPEKALPYENKALELLKEVQHKARTFIAKTSYDPPPIKVGELRMKGDLKKFNTKYKRELQLTQVQIQDLAGKVGANLDKDWSDVQKKDAMVLVSVLSPLAVQAGMDKWKVISLLQKKLNNNMLTSEEIKTVKQGVFILSQVQQSGSRPGVKGDEKLEAAFWKNYL